ncbi:hypothetical protein QP426_00655 [Pauljensenia sp. UMB1235]|uniref:hypothetical protein n=1 Tax=Actinomycetaceae TaxID=2049 RepID=UPI00189BC167|nr:MULTISPECIES: hypothetical protein [Actinomycetaceae]MDK6399567.1 hypothetical protein [Pauljensenia sp. UMB9872]MDK7172186.1 hypothetical protein [Pauljensenia sp. UMB1235]
MSGPLAIVKMKDGSEQYCYAGAFINTDEVDEDSLKNLVKVKIVALIDDEPITPKPESEEKQAEPEPEAKSEPVKPTGRGRAGKTK